MERYFIDAGGRLQPDRRADAHLRAIFEQACAVVLPFIDPANQWGHRSLDRLAFHALRERFPQITAEQARILVAACVRRQCCDRRAAPAAAS